jgi:hypothetical protein
MKKIIIAICLMLSFSIVFAEDKKQNYKVPKMQMIAFDQNTGVGIFCLDGNMILVVYGAGTQQLMEMVDGKLVLKKCICESL